MEKIYAILGQGEELTALQMCARAAVMFGIMLALIRIGGVRIFGKRSGFDTIIMITLGSVMARGIVGASPFTATVLASLTLVAVHRLLGWLSAISAPAERLIKGGQQTLYKDGHIIRKNLIRASLSETDLFESLRLETKRNSLDDVEEAFIETNGRISFILKSESSQHAKLA